MTCSRRSFLQSSVSSACAAAAGLSRPAWAGVARPQQRAQQTQRANNPLCVFTKPFCHLSFEELGQRIAALGFDGLEAPIRKGGHVEPADVADRLPELVSTLQRHQLVINIMASDINDPSDPLTETVLRTAAEQGVRFYRMKYYKYDESRPIRPQLQDFRKRLIDLAAMNRELGVTALYQNHAGRNYFGAGLWDLHIALQGISPDAVGVAYDIRHATAEAGMSWPVNLRLLLPQVKAVYVKDFQWGPQKVQNVPLGTGRISDTFFQLLEEAGFAGPVSLHEEYLDHRDPQLVDQHCQAIGKDLEQLRKWLR
ncbi:MAG: sugar phosphate isomerase/epimerase [Planctomycetaceae bacterium]|nr:sugar phosphate isomerase/epimerase [Planctomycetaceae bacterium]